MKSINLLIATSILLAACSDKQGQQSFELPPVPVQTASVETRDVPLYFEALGVVKPAQTADVRPQVTGMIKEVHFTDGEWVEEGTLLFTIEDAPYAIRVQEQQSQLSQDLAHLNNAKKKLSRFKSLTNQDLIAKVEWDELETQIMLHEAVVQADEARLAAAKLDLEHCRIVAPIAGFAGKSALGKGNMVSDAPLVTLTRNDPLYVDFTITEKELKQVIPSSVGTLTFDKASAPGLQEAKPMSKQPMCKHMGDADSCKDGDAGAVKSGGSNRTWYTLATPLIKVYSAGSEEYIAAGKVTFLDHALDPKSGMLAATGVLVKSLKPLWPGQSVRVHLYFGKKEKAKLIPMRAVKTNQDGPYIFIVNESGAVEIRTIKLGPEEKGQIVVEEGLDGISKVITEGHLRLFPGAKVEESR